MPRLATLIVTYPWIGVFVVGLGTMVVPFDSSVNVAFPHIIRAFALPIPAIQWVVIAYTLTYAALTLVFGRLGDMIGHRFVFLAGCACSALAFGLCAAALSYPMLLGARVLQGVGAALTLSCGPAIATSLYPEADRPRILGYYTMAFGLGSVLGPIMAGLMIGTFGWQAVFWFRAPVALAAFGMAFGLPAGRGGVRQSFDTPGALLLVLSIGAMLMALNQLKVLGWWCAAAWLATAAAATLFTLRQLRVRHPIIDVRYFRDPDFALVNAAHAALNVAGFSIMLLVPFYLDRLGGLSVPVSGIVLASSPLGIVLAAPLAGRLATRVPPRFLALVGSVAMAVAQIAIGMAGDPPHISVLCLSMFVQGFGLGLFQVAYFDIATATIPKENRGVAGSLVMVTRTVGVVTGATVLMLIFQTLRAGASARGVPDTEAFLTGFQGAFRIAAAMPVLVTIAGVLRGWGRRR
jgi:EmrB/QacA subfamily drug resistance transporter